MTPSRSPHLVEACADRADELLRLGCLNYGNDTAGRWAAARALLDEDATRAGRTLHAAAATGDVAATEALLAGGADANADGGPFQWPPLLYLTYSRLGVGDAVAVARLLLAAGADPNARFLWDGLEPPFTALTGVFGRGEQAAPPHGDEPALARVLLEAGADADDGQSAYNRSLGDIATDDTEWLALLFEFGLADVDLLADLLQHAAEHGLARRVELLLAHGTDPNEPGRHPGFSGRRPYEGAVGHGNLAIAEALAAAGADTSGVDDLTHAVGHLLALGPSDAVDAIDVVDPALVERARAERPDLIGEATELGRADAVRRLVVLGWDIDHRPRATALHKAAWRDDRAFVDLLLDLGADPTVTDCEFNGTPAGWAHHGGHETLARYLEARRIVHANSFLILATADGAGDPWATPVWFAHERLGRFVWGSKPGARHSANIAARGAVGIVVFDSSAPPDAISGAYFEARAAEVPDDELDATLAVYSARSVARGLPPWERRQVTGAAAHRLYAAEVVAAWILDDHDERLEVS